MTTPLALAGRALEQHDRQTVFDVAANAESLSEPLHVLFERLETGSTGQKSSSPTEDGSLSLSEAEQLTVDRLFSRLDA